MSSELDFTTIEKKALGALQLKLGVKAVDLRSGMKRAGRRLPKDAHRAAEVIGAAKMQAAHPKLARMVDASAVEAAAERLHGHLEKIDPKERRKDLVLSMLGAQAFNILAVIALVVGLMIWRGLL